MKNKSNQSSLKLYSIALLPGGFILPLFMVWGITLANFFSDTEEGYHINPSLVAIIIAAMINIGLYAVVVLVSYLSLYIF